MLDKNQKRIKDEHQQIMHTLMKDEDKRTVDEIKLMIAFFK